MTEELAEVLDWVTQDPDCGEFPEATFTSSGTHVQPSLAAVGSFFPPEAFPTHFVCGSHASLSLAPRNALSCDAMVGFESFDEPGRSGRTAPSSNASRGRKERQHVVSHSSVEKARRDRINCLIDELRDLVPPQQGEAEGTTAEARRAKHQVLADTIQQLRQMKEQLSLEQGAAATRKDGGARCHSDPTNGENALANSVSSLEQQAIPDTGAATNDQLQTSLPTIPVPRCSVFGVTVERGPGRTIYIQVKCRDRPNLLCDIVTALSLMPLEVFSAAVTTRDGLAHNTFEVRADSASLTCEEVSQMLHDALFQHQQPPSRDTEHPARRRSHSSGGAAMAPPAAAAAAAAGSLAAAAAGLTVACSGPAPSTARRSSALAAGLECPAGVGLPAISKRQKRQSHE